jgi:general secretion pathway protein N
VRPLFAADRRPHPFVLDASAGGDEARGNGFDYMLTSVLIAPPLQMAILQPTGGGEGIRVRLGESSKAFPDWRLVELDPRSAVFEGPGGRRVLPLRTFDGTGGEPPSHMPDANRRVRETAAARAEAAEAAAEAAAASRRGQATEPTQVQRQAEAIRRRIEARRAQMRREADNSSAPSPESVESDP